MKKEEMEEEIHRIKVFKDLIEILSDTIETLKENNLALNMKLDKINNRLKPQEDTINHTDV